MGRGQCGQDSSGREGWASSLGVVMVSVDGAALPIAQALFQRFECLPPYALRTMSVGEAVMLLDLQQSGVVMFRHAGHGGLNVVYRRADGNIGWIDPDLRAN